MPVASRHRFGCPRSVALGMAALFALAPPVEGEEPSRTIVVELFTSQGCSSCPPADRLLRELAADPDYHQRVLPLAFHVDYWNQIGWQDPFSEAEWSERQRLYAYALGEDGIYTPQLVIDGRTHVVGSQRRAVRREIQEALAREVEAELSFSVRPGATPDALAVRVTAARLGAGPVGTPIAYLALYEDGFVTPVGRGENGRRTLENDRVVRRLVPVVALEPGANRSATGSVTLHLEPAWRRDRLGLVALLQDPESLEIHAAATSEASAVSDPLSRRVGPTAAST